MKKAYEDGIWSLGLFFFIVEDIWCSLIGEEKERC